MNGDRANKIVILLMALGISALFLTMIQQFLMALFLAGLFSALARPLYLHLYRRFDGRAHLASGLTLAVMSVMVLIPLALLVAVLVGQALDVSQVISDRFKGALEDPAAFAESLQHLPFLDQLIEHRDLILQHAGQAASLASGFLVDLVSSFTLGTANLIFMFFVLLYSMYFLQMDGPKLIVKILYYLPLKTAEERLMLEKFTSVTRATLKGSLLIGLLQGTLAGFAFFVAGIDNAVFWGSVMAVFSTIPNVGAALVWIPASVMLVLDGHVVTGVLLALFCGLVVGSMDNVLRPILVGKDTKMHELMIFFSTLGGIFMFGLAGVFIGPLIASLFISIWEMYGVEFDDILPDVDLVLLGLHEEKGGEQVVETPPESEGDSAVSESVASADEASSGSIEGRG
nr:AI-2E family transporter [Imhoffiella purpurea]